LKNLLANRVPQHLLAELSQHNPHSSVDKIHPGNSGIAFG
jgi:hypothetical protein